MRCSSSRQPPITKSVALNQIRPWVFLAGWIITGTLLATPLRATFALAAAHEWYSQILLVVPVSLGLIAFNSQKTLRNQRTKSGLALVALLGFTAWLSYPWPSTATPDGGLWLPMLILAAIWISLFYAWHGAEAVGEATFPLGFLLLLAPVPAGWMEQVVYFLQQNSVRATEFLFLLVGIPAERHGFVFDLPGLTIEVAEECSGIHSAIALFLASMIAAHLVLRTPWKQVVFALIAVPVAILKNAIRIVVISGLSVYWDPDIIDGPLHHQGGPIFALVGLALLAPVLYVLWRTEAPATPQETPVNPVNPPIQALHE